MIILDTDILVDLLRDYPPTVSWLNSLGDEKIALPGFVVMELLQGCKNKSEQEKVEKILLAYQIIWPSRVACSEALSVFSKFRLSHSIGILDALIGQIAVDWGLPIHTFNKKHYEVIPKLKTIQPYQRIEM